MKRNDAPQMTPGTAINDQSATAEELGFGKLMVRDTEVLPKC
jgi:hypothetical protein